MSKHFLSGEGLWTWLIGTDKPLGFGKTYPRILKSSWVLGRGQLPQMIRHVYSLDLLGKIFGNPTSVHLTRNSGLVNDLDSSWYLVNSELEIQLRYTNHFGYTSEWEALLSYSSHRQGWQRTEQTCLITAMLVVLTPAKWHRIYK